VETEIDFTAVRPVPTTLKPPVVPSSKVQLRS
jgi:hypothetical protein